MRIPEVGEVVLLRVIMNGLNLLFLFDLFYFFCFVFCVTKKKTQTAPTGETGGSRAEKIYGSIPSYNTSTTSVF